MPLQRNLMNLFSATVEMLLEIVYYGKNSNFVLFPHIQRQKRPLQVGSQTKMVSNGKNIPCDVKNSVNAYEASFVAKYNQEVKLHKNSADTDGASFFQKLLGGNKNEPIYNTASDCQGDSKC
jgi:hypothetical protein